MEVAVKFFAWLRDWSELRRLRKEVAVLRKEEGSLKTLAARVLRRDEEIECLKRQRDAALETLEKLQWSSRLSTARAMARVKELGVMDDSPGDVR